MREGDERRPGDNEETKMAKDKSKSDEQSTVTTESTTTEKRRGPRKGQLRGPVIGWTKARNKALVQTIASGTNQIDDLAAALADHPAFEDVASLVNRQRVHAHIVTLRNQGVDIPRLAVRRESVAIDVDGLNALLGAGAGESEEAQA